MAERKTSPSDVPDVPASPSVHLLALRNPSSVSDPRAWGLSGDERRLHMSRVAAGTLTSGDGNEFSDRHAVKMTNRLRSAASLVDRRAWSLDAEERRRFMLDTIRRSPPASTTDLKHQELMAQLRENNLPEFVERLLSDKNEQIEDLELNIRSLALQSMRSSSAGDRTPGLPEVVNASLLSEHQYSPEVLRHAATSASSDAAELSRPDLSMLPDKQEPARPASPTASDHSWDSAPTVAGSAGAARSSAGSELATSAVTSSSSDSIQHLRAALKRKKQLLNSRKQQLEQSRQGAALQPAAPDDVENPAVSPPQSAVSPPQPAVSLSQSAVSPPQPALSPPQPAVSPPQPAVSPPQPAAGLEQLVRLQQLEHLRARLDVLNPILTQLDRDYTAMMDSVADQKMTASETELRLMAEVAEMRQTIEQQDAAHSQLQQHVQQLRGQGVPDSDPLLRSVEEQLLAILRDMEINKLEACGKMHETSALLARTQRQSQQQDGDNGSELVSSGYISMSPRTASEGPPPPPPPPSLPSSQAWHETTNAETGSESTFHSDTARSDPGYSADKFSCPSLTDEMSDLGDINEEVDQLRARIGELERELGQRGDAPTRDPSDGQWRDRLDSERAAWSRERQHLQQVITRLDEEQERQRRLGARSGDGDEARVQQANGRYLRSESFRRALCWQKRYLMVLLGGYQDTETMTLERMTLLTGGTFWPDGRSYLSPLRKFRAAALVLVAIRRMGYMVNRWRSAGRLAGAPTVSWHPAVPRPAPTVRPLSPAVRPLSPASFVSESSRDADAELNALDRIVRDCAGSAPNLHDRPDSFDARSVVTVSDVCTDDLEPYLARFDALLERQGYPPQSGSQR